MNSPSPVWRILKAGALTLAVIALCATLYCLVALDGIKQTYFAVCCGLIAINFFAMFIFLRINGNKNSKRK